MNKLFKITAIIMILAISMFTMGCESQEEKFDRIEQKLINLDNQTSTNVPVTPTREGAIIIIKACERFISESEPLMKELDQIAKGNPKLEKRMEKKWRDYKNYIKLNKEGINKLKQRWSIQ